MKGKIAAFLGDLTAYDYILFGSSFVLFILFLILALLLRNKKILSAVLLLLSFTTLFVGPTLGYVKLHQFLYAHTLKLTSYKQLEFTPAVLVEGSLKNNSSRLFKECHITAEVHKVSQNKLKNYIYSFKRLKSSSIVETNVDRNETRPFKMFIEPFRYAKDFNVSLKASCR